ncbi:FAD-dependent oxidoreductase [Streptomyces cacaoi]|uniref:FAD-dependent oxidoreductase n=1 Tax=Streptomyces cacaoi TaxID=1898 RepID=UPI0033AF03B7
MVILGAGIVGAACARELAHAGFDVTVLDRAGAAGATTAHGEGNILVSDKEPGPELQLAQLSRDLWPRTLESVAAGPLGPTAAARAEWAAKGGIVVATTAAGADALHAFADRQRTAGVRAEPLTRAQLAHAEPHITAEHTAAVHYPDDAQVQPAAATVLLADARAAGARVHTCQEVRSAVVHGGRLTAVRTDTGRHEAEVFLDAAGPWSAELSARLGVFLGVHPRRGEVLVTTPLPPTVFHKVYDADYVDAVGSGDGTLQTSAVVESTAAGTVLIGSSRRRVGFDDRLRPEVLSAVAAKAVRLFPALARVPAMRAYGGFRPYVTDHLPVIGPDPRLPGLWHATGHEGAGIGLSLGTAHLLRTLLLDETPPLDPTPFRVDRPAVTEVTEGSATPEQSANRPDMRTGAPGSGGLLEGAEPPVAGGCRGARGTPGRSLGEPPDARPARPRGKGAKPQRKPGGGTELHLTVDGAPVQGTQGQTLAATLLAAGRTSWRRTTTSAPRGLFCAIGTCFDCLVTVNGEPDVRACRRRAADGDVLTSQSRSTNTGHRPAPDRDRPRGDAR